MFGLGGAEILIIVLIILLVFGAKRLPDVGAGLGKTVREIRSIKKELRKEASSAAGKKETEKGAEAPESKEASAEGKLVHTLEDKLKKKVIDQVPGIGQARKIKDKAEQIKKIVS